MYGRPCVNVKVEPCSTKCMIYWQCSSFVVTGNLNCLFPYDQDAVSTASVHAFVANMTVTSLSPGFFHKYTWMYNSGTLQPQQAMLFSYQAVSSGRNSRASLCQRKVSKWHICISKPITKNLWTPFGYLCVKKLIYS